MTVRDDDKKWRAYLDQMSKISGLEATAGIFDDDIAEYASFNEFGTADIPERPFMRNAFDLGRRDIDKASVDAVNEVIDGVRLKVALQGVADVMRDLIVESIKGGDFKPLKRSTAVAKGHATPLRETDAMVRSIEARVVKRGADE